MEPNQKNSLRSPVSAPGMAARPLNAQNATNAPVAPGAATPAKNDVVFRDKPKKNIAVILGMVLLGILAVGGIVFGVWAMMDGNSQVAKKDEQIRDLNRQLAEKSDMVDGSGIVNGNAQSIGPLENPVIEAVLPAQYSIRHSIPVVSTESPNGATMTFSSVDGGNLECRFPNSAVAGGCNVSGVPDGIYKIMTIRDGNGIGSEKVGFLMKDGTVWFAQIYNNGDANVGVNTNLQAKRVNIDGFIKDVVEVGYTSNIDEPTSGSGLSTVFVMSDNSLIKYDDSLFSE